VGEQVIVGNGCVFGAETKVTPSQTVPDNSVFYGEPLKHRLAGERPSVRLNISTQANFHVNNYSCLLIIY